MTSLPASSAPRLSRARTAATAAAVALLVAVGLTSAVAPAEAASQTTAANLLTKLPVAAESNSGYDRSLFQHWTDADKDCQSTRHEVLIKETTVTPTYSSRRCTVTKGKWVSKWDQKTWTNPSDVDIDHHVALAEAWGSGARRWTSTERRAFANDLYGPSLNAVTDNLNSAKGARDPAEWLPPVTGQRCSYAIWWLQVKYRWRLTVDAKEKAALTNILSGSCGNRQVTVPARAR